MVCRRNIVLSPRKGVRHLPSSVKERDWEMQTRGVRCKALKLSTVQVEVVFEMGGVGTSPVPE